MTDIAKILKDAPRNLKLYSLVHGEVTLKSVDTRQDYYPIKTICKEDNFSKSYSKEGKMYYEYEDDECILFPSKEHKSWDDWQDILFQRGDVITVSGGEILLFNSTDYAFTNKAESRVITKNIYRYATPEERDQFFKELNANGYTWNDNTKQIEKSLQQDKHKDCLGCVYTETKEESFTINQLKPFDKVLVQDIRSHWTCDFYIRYDNTHKLYACITSTWDKCIPYNDETKHLLGTTDDCPKKYKTW